MSDLALASTIQATTARNTFAFLRSVNNSLATVQNRLVTGMRVNSPLDDPQAFFGSRALSSQARQLLSVKDGLAQGIQLLRGSETGLQTMATQLSAARDLANRALTNLESGGDRQQRASYARDFNEILSQMNSVVRDSGLNGRNLLNASRDVFFMPDARSIAGLLALSGIESARGTNLTRASSFDVRITGTGLISGDADDVATAQGSLGVDNLLVTGLNARSSGSFADIHLSVRGERGGARTLTVSEGNETRAITFSTDQLRDGQTVSHRFGSGTVVQFDVDLASLDAAATGAATRRDATIGKNVDLQITASDGTTTVTRSLNVDADIGRLLAGENAFGFDSGTLRLGVNERTVQGAARSDGAVSDVYGLARSALIGAPDLGGRGLLGGGYELRLEAGGRADGEPFRFTLLGPDGQPVRVAEANRYQPPAADPLPVDPPPVDETPPTTGGGTSTDIFRLAVSGEATSVEIGDVLLSEAGSRAVVIGRETGDDGSSALYLADVDGTDWNGALSVERPAGPVALPLQAVGGLQLVDDPAQLPPLLGGGEEVEPADPADPVEPVPPPAEPDPSTAIFSLTYKNEARPPWNYEIQIGDTVTSAGGATATVVGKEAGEKSNSGTLLLSNVQGDNWNGALFVDTEFGAIPAAVGNGDLTLVQPPVAPAPTEPPPVDPVAPVDPAPGEPSTAQQYSLDFRADGWFGRSLQIGDEIRSFWGSSATIADIDYDGRGRGRLILDDVAGSRWSGPLYVDGRFGGTPAAFSRGALETYAPPVDPPAAPPPADPPPADPPETPSPVDPVEPPTQFDPGDRFSLDFRNDGLFGRTLQVGDEIRSATGSSATIVGIDADGSGRGSLVLEAVQGDSWNGPLLVETETGWRPAAISQGNFQAYEPPVDPPPVAPPPVDPPPVDPPQPDPFTAVLDENGRLSFTGLGADGAATISFRFDAGQLATLASSRSWDGAVEGALRFDVRQASADDLRSGAALRINQVGGTQDRSYRVDFGGQTGAGIDLRALDLTTNGLGLGVDEAANDWNSRADIQRTLEALDRAERRLESGATTLQTQLQVVQSRSLFNDQLADLLQTQSRQMLASDSPRDYAQALALNSRQQLALTGLSMMFNSSASIFDLMGDSGFGSGFGRRGFFT